MKFSLPAAYAASPEGQEAARILQGCVHCGMCTAVCPTYRVLGDELDGPRGRIYLIKSLLEGAPAGAETRTHLDRCLSCGACQTTCPSGVEYTSLLDLGRAHAEGLAPRPLLERAVRAALLASLPHPGRVAALFRLGSPWRSLLPRAWRALAAPPAPPGAWPAPRHPRRAVVLRGCVHPTLAPRTDAALARCLERLGVSALASPAGCCGAMDHHLGRPDVALAHARRNIGAWLPLLDAGAEYLIHTASGCAAQIKGYPYLFRHVPALAAGAARIAAALRDPADLLMELPWERLGEAGAAAARPRVAVHLPCTQQHHLRSRATGATVLAALGFPLVPVADPGQCCGAAGGYFLLHPRLAGEIGRLKAAALTAGALEAGGAEIVATANLGCALGLRARLAIPVVHWLELVDPAGPP
jgi:glycolate oxidase iron-sulfur subunit